MNSVFFAEELTADVFFSFYQFALETFWPTMFCFVVFFYGHTSRHWCSRSCLFKGMQDGIILLRASCPPPHVTALELNSEQRMAGWFTCRWIAADPRTGRSDAADAFRVHMQLYGTCVPNAGLWSGW